MPKEGEGHKNGSDDHHPPSSQCAGAGTCDGSRQLNASKQWMKKVQELVRQDAGGGEVRRERGRDGRRKAGGSREAGEISDDSSGTLSPPSADDDDPATQDTGPIDADDMHDIFFDISGKDATTLETVHEFARYLGIDPVADKTFLWIAVEAMVAQLPANWAEYKTVDDQTYYYNERLGVTQWEHPMDDYHRCLFLRLKAKGGDDRGKERKSKSKDQHSGKQVEKGKEMGGAAYPKS